MAQRQSPKDAADALRTAVDRTVTATVGQAAVTRGRAQELVDDVAQAAGRVRDVLEDLRVATKEDLREIRGELDRLDARIATLESRASAARRPAAAKGSKSKPKGKAKAAAGKPTAAKRKAPGGK